METDKYQQAWQAQSSQTRVTVDAERLLKEVERSQRAFRATIFWRDFREVVVALLMIPVWFYLGAKTSSPWTWYLTVPVLVWISGFMLFYRLRYAQKPNRPDEPLVQCVKNSLADMENQIWLLRNIFWWYLLPPTISLLAFFGHVAWLSSRNWWEFLSSVLFGSGFIALVYGAVYYLNQRAVRTQLEPRRQKLLALRASLEDEATGEDSHEIVDLVSALADPVLCRGWAQNWNRMIPSWREATAIILATLAGAFCGLWFPIREMGPVFFQSVVGAVIAFEAALVCVWLRSRRKRHNQSPPANHGPKALAARVDPEKSANQTPQRLPRAPAILIIGLTIFLSIMAVLALYRFVEDTRHRSMDNSQDYPKKSPFAAVRWQDSQPEVRVGNEWFRLLSLDELPASEIVAFSQQTYGDRWQKRFEEDLVEVLTRMGHPPDDTVTLVVQSLTSSETRTLEDVPMTEANRRAIRDAAQAREHDEERQSPQSAVHADGAEIALKDLIPKLRKEKKLVGLAAMLVVDGQVVASAVDGERKSGSGVRLEIGDRWHLGSITKSITATMIARLVESGQMRWTDSIGQCFPEASIHESWKPVTLKRLLTHTAGAPANFSVHVALKRPAVGPDCTQARREAVLEVLAQKPAHPPGEKFAYSNVGYTIAGAMAEKATGETWEDLVKREVFEPLELTGVGFGPPKSPDKTLDQPRGHRTAFGWKVSVNDEADNTPIIGPAGLVHMTLRDLCTYATDHLRGDVGAGKLLSGETYKLLHTPEFNRYACGWVRNEPTARIPHNVYWHNGSNTMWYALVVFIPEKKMAVAVTSNDGDVEKAEAAAWEVVRASAQQVNAGAD